jgi:glycosyltransferase involved in cell wall biosynthesis
MAGADVSIVIPCLNEARNLEVLLPRIHDVIRERRIPAEVFVIDGASTDGTREVAHRLGATVIPQRGHGYGGATRTAFEDLATDYIITIDADFSHHPAFIKYLYDARDQGEIIIASRYADEGHATMPWLRKTLSIVLNAAFRRILAIPVHDLSSGYRLYHRRAIARLRLQYDTYAILQEILVKALCEGYKVKEIPFHYLPRRHGATNVRHLQFAIVYLQALRALWRIRNDVTSADYDTRAFYSRIPPQRWWQRKRYRIILDYIDEGKRVLDAGCGSSQILNGAPQIVGLDILHRKLRFMRRPGRRLIQGSALALPFPDEAFEVIVASQVIEHLPDDGAVFTEMARCLEPGGTMIVGTPAHSQSWPMFKRLRRAMWPPGDAREHTTPYTRTILTERLEAAGLDVEAYEYILKTELILKARKRSRPDASCQDAVSMGHHTS